MINPSTHNTEDKVKEASEENLGEENLTKVPPKEFPENSKTKDADKDRCRYCREIGHWVKDCPQKEKDLAKKDTENAFSGLSEIAQDFYGDRTTEMFHGITEDYVDSSKEGAPGQQDGDSQDPTDYLN